MATRAACVASVRVSAGERAKSDRVKIGARGRANDGCTLAVSSKHTLPVFFFAFTPVFARLESEKLFIRTQATKGENKLITSNDCR